jgi:glycosyltransferase involved in cell wall biosynthesis
MQHGENGARPRILAVADVLGWIFERHARAFADALADEFDFSVAFAGAPFAEGDYDLVYPLEWNLADPRQIENPAKWVTGIRSHLTWSELPFDAVCAHLSQRFQRVHVVSRRLERVFRGRVPALAYVTHGVDTSFFRPRTSVARREPALRVGWAGNRRARVKGFDELVAPLAELPGVELGVCGYADRMLTREEMRAFYDSIDVFVCTSLSEGNSNALLEAAAMARAIVTTDVGTVPEYLIDGESALVVDRKPEAFAGALERLRDPRLRGALGRAARAAVERHFAASARMQDFRRFFRDALAAARASATPAPPRLWLAASGAPPAGWRALGCAAARGDDPAPDLAALRGLPAGSLDEIALVSALCWYRPFEARELLAAAARALAPGGRLCVEDVDAGEAARALVNARGDLARHLAALRAFVGFPGDADPEREFVPHRFTWSPWHLERELRRAGFTRFANEPPRPGAGPCRFRLVASR